MKYLFYISCLVLYSYLPVFAQVGSLQLVSGSVCTGTVETPILANQLNQFASMSVKLNYDSNALVYAGVRNVHPAIASAITAVNNGKFVIAWFSLQPVSIANDTLLVIRWNARNQTAVSSLQFDTQTFGNCEIANVQGQVLTVQYLGGTASITGAIAPQPLTANRLANLNQSNYLFVYNRSSCMSQAIIMFAADSGFTQNVTQSVMTDTFHRVYFTGVQPALGDSVRWWRMGGVYGADTAWSAPGRIGFALSLSKENLRSPSAKIYPNPFQNRLRLSHPMLQTGEVIAIKLYTIHGQLLEELSLIPQADWVEIEIKNTEYHGQILISWQQSGNRGLLLGNKIGY